MSKKTITLNKEQDAILQAAVHWFYYESSQLFEIDGLAGTGKSFLMGQILRALKLKSNEFYPMAYTGQAAIVMRQKGFYNARSIHSTLYELKEIVVDDENFAKKYGREKVIKVFEKVDYIDPNIKLFFIDEAYMVPRSMVQDIMSFGIKVIVCGDQHQLPPIQDDPGFLVNPGVHHLTQLMRQANDSAIIYIANRVLEGKPIHSGYYGNDVLVIDEEDLLDEMLLNSQAICCACNATRDILNSYIRNLRGYHGRFPHYGERVICRKNNWEVEIDNISLTNGLTGTVLNEPCPDNTNPLNFLIDFKPDLINNYLTKLPCSIEYFTSDWNTRRRMKSLDDNYYSHKSFRRQGEYFEFAYSLTTHLAQGGEYPIGMYIEEYWRNADEKAKLNYTGVTRFKNKLIYVKKKGSVLFGKNY